MVNALRKMFIKDYKNTSNPKVRDKHAMLATIMGIITNVILFVIKLFAGIISGSVAIIGDALNNLSDMGSSVITILGFKMASRPADTKHPYGHERMEYISGLVVSIAIIIMSIQVFGDSIEALVMNKQAEFSIVALVILGVSILIKLWQGLIYKKIGKVIDSVALEANFKDSFNDSISTLVILIGGLIIYFVPNIPFALDGVLGIFVAIFIFQSGVSSLKDTIDPLIGMNPKHEYVKKIIEDVKSYPVVLGVHDVRCHMYGPTKSFMTLHVEISSNEEILKAHDQIDNIERDIRKKYGVDLTIHMDPIENDDDETLELKAIVENAVNKLGLSFHDFRIVQGDTHTNILFDVVVPAKYRLTSDEIQQVIEDEFKEAKQKYYFVINFDGEYIDQI